MIMGDYERRQRKARRAEERRKRGEVLRAAQADTPVTGYGLWKQRRDTGWTEYTDGLGNRRWRPPAAEAQAKTEEKPATVQRSPEEKPAAVQQGGGDVNAFGSFKQNIASGLVRKMDINGNWQWVDPIRKVRADTGMPLNPGRTAGGTVSAQSDSTAKPPDTSAEGAQPTLSDDGVAQITDVNAPTAETEGALRDSSVLQGHSAEEVAGKMFKAISLSRADPARLVGNWAADGNNEKVRADKAMYNLYTKYWNNMTDEDRQAFTTEITRLAGEQSTEGGSNPVTADSEPKLAAVENEVEDDDDEEKDQAAAKAGYAGRFDVSRNFLATDRVPDSIFGYPVVSRKEDYTEEDIAFFREHPEAGGYYDLGEGVEPPEPPEGPLPDEGGRRR